ncbi:MAG: helix-turn-helix domain-containing protein [Verrucomicrobiota bacterium]
MNSPAAKPPSSRSVRSDPSDAVHQRLADQLRVVGRKLRDRREERDWPQELAAKKTKIKLPQIQALEQGNLEAFASPSYARGFASIYLRTLGFDDRAELSRFDDLLDVHPEERLEKISGLEHRPGPLPVETREAPSTLGFKVVIACTLVVVAVIALVGFQSYKAGMIRVTSTDGIRADAGNLDPAAENAELASLDELKPSTAPPAAVAVAAEEAAPAPVAARAEAVAIPAQAAEPEPAASPSGIYNVELFAQRSSFVSVVSHRANGGKSRFTGTMKRGERRQFEGTRLDVMIAVPAAIHIVYNGEDQGPYSYSVVPASFTIPAEAQ